MRSQSNSRRRRARERGRQAHVRQVKQDRQRQPDELDDPTNAYGLRDADGEPGNVSE